MEGIVDEQGYLLTVLANPMLIFLGYPTHLVNLLNHEPFDFIF